MTDPTSQTDRQIRLCTTEAIAEGTSKGFDPQDTGRDTMFIVRRNGRFYGYRNACPHYDGARMAWRKNAYLNANGTRIRCSAHGALFHIATGQCELGPCIGQRLDVVPLIHRDGGIWISIPSQNR